MDMDEVEVLAEEEPREWFNPVTFLFQLLATYGWYMVGAGAVLLYAAHRLRPVYRRWQEAREDAEYHKDPDKVLSRMEAVQRARERQQQLLLEASERAKEQQREREERKRQEAVERLQKYGTAAGGRRLGNAADDDGYLPLSGGGGSVSSYRPPKRSKCSGGGCG